MIEQINALISRIRDEKPLILNITNAVTMDFIANGLLSLGASPIMSQAEEELDDLIRISSAVVINIGTLNESFIQLATRTMQIANQLDKPIIFDPVGAGASRYRTDTTMKLLCKNKVAIIRGNAGEILAIAGEAAATKGVDSIAKSDAVIDQAKKVSSEFSATILMSGKTDVVIENNQLELFDRGSDLMPTITGSGCLLTAVVAAFHAVEKNRFLAASTAAVFYGVCGEIAATCSSHPGSLKPVFIDALKQPYEKTCYEKK